MNLLKNGWLCALALFTGSIPMDAQSPSLILTEREVPPHDLPDVLALPDGCSIRTAEAWSDKTRPALIETFEQVLYGVTPKVPVLSYFNDSIDDSDGRPPADALVMLVENESTRTIFGGKALLRQSTLRFTYHDRSASFEVMLVLPTAAKQPVPAFVGLNFWGNHTTDALPSIHLAPEVPGMERKERGSHAHRWNLESLVDAGYAVATAYRGDIVPDSPAHAQSDVLRLFRKEDANPPMGAIGAWAWALSRIADYLQGIPEVDHERLTVIGHSRLGKAALWAGAQDERFSRVIANNSGCMGAALSRRRFGETLAIITRNFPYWFAPGLSKYADDENTLPVDQHQLLALIAPRPLYLGSAEQDLWADPRGELLALREAAKVYRLFGIEATIPDQLPAVGTSVGDHLRFHHRAGKHDITPEDWAFYLRD